MKKNLSTFKGTFIAPQIYSAYIIHFIGQFFLFDYFLFKVYLFGTLLLHYPDFLSFPYL